MKKILMLMVTGLVLVGCGSDSDKCLRNVQAKYPNSDIVVDPSNRFTFIVKSTDGSIHLIKTNYATTTDISSDLIIFKSR